MVSSASSATTPDGAATPEQARLGPAALTRHVGYLLRRAYVLSNDCSKSCIPDDTQLREVEVLALLAEREPMSQRELGDGLFVNRSVMVKLLDSIEAKGWVVRARNRRDRRSYALRLTTSGSRTLADRLADLSSGDDQLTARLNQRERRWLNRCLLDVLDDRDLAPIASLSRHSGYLIAQAHQQMRRRAEERLAPIGLGPRDFGVLNVLAANRPCSQNQLAAIIGVSPPAALTFVDELEAGGLVTRRRSTSDRRVYDVRLTDEGERRLEAARDAATELEHDVATRLGDRYDELRRLLLTLLA